MARAERVKTQRDYFDECYYSLPLPDPLGGGWGTLQLDPTGVSQSTHLCSLEARPVRDPTQLCDGMCSVDVCCAQDQISSEVM